MLRLLLLLLVSIGVSATAAVGKAPYPSTRLTAVAGEVEAPCPADALMIVGAGQSNAGNHLTGRLSVRADIPAYMMLDGRCYLIHDPVLGSTRDKKGPTYHGSLWSRVAQRLAVRLGRPVVVLTSGLGGYSSADWLADVWGARTWLENQISASPLVPRHVVWVHGESDAIAGTAEALYGRRISLLFDVLSARAPGARFWISMESRCGSAISAAVRRGQAGLTNSRHDTWLIGNLDALGPGYRRPDACHFNGAGASRVATMIADAIAAEELR